jgi:hypothetical protein
MSTPYSRDDHLSECGAQSVRFRRHLDATFGGDGKVLTRFGGGGLTDETEVPPRLGAPVALALEG